MRQRLAASGGGGPCCRRAASSPRATSCSCCEPALRPWTRRSRAPARVARRGVRRAGARRVLASLAMAAVGPFPRRSRGSLPRGSPSGPRCCCRCRGGAGTRLRAGRGSASGRPGAARACRAPRCASDRPRPRAARFRAARLAGRFAFADRHRAGAGRGPARLTEDARGRPADPDGEGAAAGADHAAADHQPAVHGADLRGHRPRRPDAERAPRAAGRDQQLDRRGRLDPRRHLRARDLRHLAAGRARRRRPLVASTAWRMLHHTGDDEVRAAAMPRRARSRTRRSCAGASSRSLPDDHRARDDRGVDRARRADAVDAAAVPPGRVRGRLRRGTRRRRALLRLQALGGGDGNASARSACS